MNSARRCFMMKKILTLLSVIGLALQAQGASVKPLYFVDEGGATIAEDLQQDYWVDLMKYKMWGTRGITFNKGTIYIVETSGYNGTARGPVVFNNGDHKIGGPFLVGGDLLFSAGNTSPDYDSLFRGPANVKGNLYMASWYDASHTRYEGDYCIQGDALVNGADDNNLKQSASRWMANVRKDGGKVYANFVGKDGDQADAPYADCPSTVPSIDDHLSVPSLPDRDDSQWDPGISMLSNVDGEIDYLDVPPYLKGDADSVYEAYLTGIEIANTPHKYLYIRMPSASHNYNEKNGRLSKFFLRDGVNIAASANSTIIQVVYVNADATWNPSTKKWDNFKEDHATFVENKDYAGNVLFYTNKNILWAALKFPSYQGTFMTTGNFTINDHFVLAGQLIADSLHFESDITGDFHYVPFDPPEIDPNLIAGQEFYENDELVEIEINLSKVPETEVSFKYCFAFFGDLSEEDQDWYKQYYDPFASEDDLKSLPAGSGTELDEMPLCSKDMYREVRIPAGKRSPVDDAYRAYIRVAKDDRYENNEWMYIQVKDLYGAVITGNYMTAGIPMKIMDLNNRAPEFDDGITLAVYENDVAATAGTVSAGDDDPDDVVTYSITGGADKDLFVINATTGVVSLKDGVAADYEAKQSYELKITATDNKTPVEQSFTVAVIDVNEKPTVESKKYDAKENLTDGAEFAKITRSDIDSLNNKTDTREFVKHNIVEAIGGDTKIFGVTLAGMVYVIHGDSLDYEKRTDYELLVRVRDTSAVDLWDTARIYIKVTDVDDPPVIVTKDTTVIIPNDPVNPDPDKADTLKNVGSNKALVYENNEAGVKVGAVVATCTDTTKTLYYDIAKDTSGLFEIDHSTGIISVKDAMVLDYETIKSYGISVVVYDGVVAKTVDGVDYDANGVKVQSASKDMTINVGDVNELPIMEEQKFEITEHNGEGAGVDQYGQAGKDEGNNYWIVVGDNDKSKEFTQHTLTVVGGDTDLFYLGGSQGDEILAKSELDFEKYAATGDTVFTLIVKATDKEPGPNGEELSVTKTMTIVLKNKNETPEIVTDTLYVTEHSKDGTSVGTLDATDPDGDSDKLTFGVSGTSSWLDVAEDGSVTVKKDSGIDYEKTSEGTITVTVTDADGATSTKTLTVIVIDVNEAPDVRDTTITVPEDAPVGKEIGHVAASDPDTKNPEYGTLTYKQLTDSDKFQVATDGTIKLIDELDYETDSVYTLKVYVTDGTLGDTATVTVKVGNVIEASKVEIITAINTDSTWHKPDTIYVNQYDLDLIWTGDGKEFKGDTTLTEGKNIIIKEFKDPSKDLPGYDTLVVYVSTATPIVTVSKAADEIEAANIYTIVENPGDTSSTTFYVNDPKSDIKVTVKDPVDSTKSTSFTLSLNLAQESLPKVSSSTVKTVSEIADATPALNEDAPNAIRTPVNGEKIEVSYTDKIAGKDVVVSYYTDNKGNILKGESGKEEMTISYTVTVDGKDVVVSFKADPLTGSLISGENGADFAVNFDYVDKSGNSVAVSYGIDEKGNIAKSASGDVGYNVSYTYVNKYGNSATQSVFIVLDQKAPLVWIKTPTKDQVIHANMVEVEWYVSVTGDSADFVLQDTLKVQGLEKGANAIVRFFIDKAGNMASDTVYVIMKNAKDVDIAVEKPLTVVNADSVAKYYADNPPKKGQTFAVSLSNPTTGEEQETLIGGSFKTKSGSGETPYKGNEGAHLGPTMSVDLKLPVYNSVGGLATLDDLVGKDGLVSLDGVDAKNSKKVTVEEYAKEYCSTDFNVNLGSDISKANLYKTSIKVKIWVYTTLGNFVDYFSFTQDLNDPELVDEAGLIKMYFEQKPDVDGFVRTADGKLYATGAYLYKTEVEMRSTAQCTLPPVDERTGIKKGSRRKTTDDLLKPFGYKRPTVK